MSDLKEIMSVNYEWRCPICKAMERAPVAEKARANCVNGHGSNLYADHVKQRFYVTVFSEKYKEQ